jgi:hypothetical protein
MPKNATRNKRSRFLEIKLGIRKGLVIGLTQIKMGILEDFHKEIMRYSP